MRESLIIEEIKNGNKKELADIYKAHRGEFVSWVTWLAAHYFVGISLHLLANRPLMERMIETGEAPKGLNPNSPGMVFLMASVWPILLVAQVMDWVSDRRGS
jgi:hypothetical protein